MNRLEAINTLNILVNSTAITVEMLIGFYENYLDTDYLVPPEIQAIYPTPAQKEELYNILVAAYDDDIESRYSGSRISSDGSGIDENDTDNENLSIYGEGVLKRDVGRLPPQVRNLLEKVKDEKITSIQAWRYPLMKPLQNIIKKIVKLPYDSVFHLGINLNGKYNLEKDVLLKFKKEKERGDTPKNTSKVYKVEKDITFGELFDGLRKTMGDAGLTEYDARTNNCQDFSLAILKVLGVNDNELKTFIKQDANKVFKAAGVFEKLAEAGAKLNTLKDQVIDRLTQGEGTGSQEGGGEGYVHNYGLPRCKIQT